MKMADLLRAGYTMLNISCPICKNPIFQDKKRHKFCPICNRDVIIGDKEESLSNKQSVNYTSSKNAEDGFRNFEDIGNLMSLKQIILEKINFIADKFKNEHQMDNIEKYTNVLVKLFELLKYI